MTIIDLINYKKELIYVENNIRRYDSGFVTNEYQKYLKKNKEKKQMEKKSKYIIELDGFELVSISSENPDGIYQSHVYDIIALKEFSEWVKDGYFSDHYEFNKADQVVPAHDDRKIKRCTTCGVEKPLKEFWHNARSSDYHTHRCAVCGIESAKKRREKEKQNKEITNSIQ